MKRNNNKLNPWAWLPTGIRYIAGPAAMYVHSLPKTNIVLFGDVHFSYRNTCMLDMTSHDIMQIHTLISQALNDKDAVLITEYPYCNHSLYADERSSWYLKRVTTALERNSSVTSELSIVLHRIFGVPAPVTGMLSKQFKLLSQHRGVLACDIRSEPNVHVWEYTMMQNSSVEIANVFFDQPSQHLSKFVLHLLCDTDAVGSITALYGASSPVSAALTRSTYVTSDIARGKRVHEMHRLFSSLNPRDQQLVKRYAKELLDNCETLFEKSKKKKRSVSAAKLVISTMQAVCMDLYVACTIMTVLRKRAVPKTILMYAGDFHSNNASSFVSMLTRRKPVFAQPVQDTLLGISRCISVGDR